MSRCVARAWLLVMVSVAMSWNKGLACEVMGFSFNERVSGRHLFADFRVRGARHVDGWGVALYPDKSLQLIKEGRPANESDLAEFLTRYKGLESDILIAFLRTGSPGCGGPSHQNSHPFLRELNGRDFVLAHEGTIHDFREKLKLGRAKPLGINDSEFLCCYLVGRMEEAGIKEWNTAAFAWIDNVLHETSALGSVTCMFSDGDYLFVYLDERDPEDLFYVRRAAPYGRVYFKHAEKEVDLSKIYTDSAKGYVFATRPLTNEKWTPLPAASLMVLKKGEVVYTTPK